MPTDIFLMDNGCGIHTRLWRRRVYRFGRAEWFWSDSPSGKAQLDFEDEEGHPVDCFGLPLDGKFVYA